MTARLILAALLVAPGAAFAQETVKVHSPWPEPTSWETLTGPSFHLAYDIGPQLQLVDPAAARVGSELLAGRTAAIGPTTAARFVGALAPNVVAAPTEAAEACLRVARGYSAVGVGVTADALAMALYARDALIVSRPGVPGATDPVPPAISRDLETIDFDALAKPAAELLAVWRAAAKPKP